MPEARLARTRAAYQDASIHHGDFGRPCAAAPRRTPSIQARGPEDEFPITAEPFYGDELEVFAGRVKDGAGRVHG